jgi:hypothetical protein
MREHEHIRRKRGLNEFAMVRYALLRKLGREPNARFLRSKLDGSGVKGGSDVPLSDDDTPSMEQICAADEDVGCL